jgi:hypothetical protein
MGVRPPAGTPEWPLEEQIRDAVSYLWWHVHFDSVAACTDQQLRCIGLWLAREEHPDALLADLSPVGLADFPPEVREHVSRLEPRMQPERDAWLRKKAGHFVREVEEMPARLAAVEEAQRRQAEESRRRDLELLHRNRARCGLPPLETEIPD